VSAEDYAHADGECEGDKGEQPTGRDGGALGELRAEEDERGEEEQLPVERPGPGEETRGGVGQDGEQREEQQGGDDAAVDQQAAE